MPFFFSYSLDQLHILPNHVSCADQSVQGAWFLFRIVPSDRPSFFCRFPAPWCTDPWWLRCSPFEISTDAGISLRIPKHSSYIHLLLAFACGSPYLLLDGYLLESTRFLASMLRFLLAFDAPDVRIPPWGPCDLSQLAHWTFLSPKFDLVSFQLLLFISRKSAYVILPTLLSDSCTTEVTFHTQRVILQFPDLVSALLRACR